MAKLAAGAPGALPRRCYLLASLLFVALAWGVAGFGEYGTSQLDVSGWGTDLDIPERLAIDGYLARHFQPYALTACGLELVAFLVMRLSVDKVDRVRGRGQMGYLGGVVFAAWVLSVGYHGLQLSVCLLFTSQMRF